MKLFKCQNCQNALHFDNTICMNCNYRVGYLEDRFEMSALEPDGPGWKALAAGGHHYMLCANAEHNVCNWLTPADSGRRLCESCRHNRIIPDLTIAANQERWRRIELAKRYMFRSLMRWLLPMPDRREDPQHGLVFDLKNDAAKADGAIEKVLTGHDEGIITLNVSEADDAEREIRRTSMGETYRTLIGHFRHEIGHYYWDRLVRDKSDFDGFRAIFGDERQDYEQALKDHYEHGAPAGWRESFITSYATSHPWEDFAETWAHYLHMVDALETARAYGINVGGQIMNNSAPLSNKFDPYRAHSADELLRAWIPLTIAINGINRSMGQPDLYPFVLSNPVMKKLQYIQELIQSNVAEKSTASDVREERLLA
jgi:hypothetical protein